MDAQHRFDLQIHNDAPTYHEIMADGQAEIDDACADATDTADLPEVVDLVERALEVASGIVSAVWEALAEEAAGLSPILCELASVALAEVDVSETADAYREDFQEYAEKAHAAALKDLPCGDCGGREDDTGMRHGCRCPDEPERC